MFESGFDTFQSSSASFFSLHCLRGHVLLLLSPVTLARLFVLLTLCMLLPSSFLVLDHRREALRALASPRPRVAVDRGADSGAGRGW